MWRVRIPARERLRDLCSGSCPGEDSDRHAWRDCIGRGEVRRAARRVPSVDGVKGRCTRPGFDGQQYGAHRKFEECAVQRSAASVRWAMLGSHQLAPPGAGIGQLNILYGRDTTAYCAEGALYRSSACTTGTTNSESSGAVTMPPSIGAAVRHHFGPGAGTPHDGQAGQDHCHRRRL
jgi:hypothetical protein